MKYLRTYAAVIGTALALSGNSYAAESEKDHLALQADKAAGIECMPAKDFVKILQKLDRLKPEQTDTVTMTPTMNFTAKDGGALPARVFYRYEGNESQFHINAQGAVPDFTRIRTMNKNGEMCMQDKTRKDAPEDGEGLELKIDMELLYKNKSGLYSLAELEDGLKDGRSHIKKIVPAPIRLLIPKFKYLDIKAKEGQTLHIRAVKEGADIPGLSILEIEGSKAVEFAQLTALGADHLRITGGAFTMGPMPSPEDMKDKKEKE